MDFPRTNDTAVTSTVANHRYLKLGREDNSNMQLVVQISWPGFGFTDNEQFNTQGMRGVGAGGADVPHASRRLEDSGGSGKDRVAAAIES